MKTYYKIKQYIVLADGQADWYEIETLLSKQMAINRLNILKKKINNPGEIYLTEITELIIEPEDD